MIETEFSSEFEVRVEYRRLPKKCEKGQKMGHTSQRCNVGEGSFKEVSNNSVEMTRPEIHYEKEEGKISPTQGPSGTKEGVQMTKNQKRKENRQLSTLNKAKAMKGNVGEVSKGKEKSLSLDQLFCCCVCLSVGVFSVSTMLFGQTTL